MDRRDFLKVLWGTAAYSLTQNLHAQTEEPLAKKVAQLIYEVSPSREGIEGYMKTEHTQKKGDACFDIYRGTSVPHMVIRFFFRMPEYKGSINLFVTLGKNKKPVFDDYKGLLEIINFRRVINPEKMDFAEIEKAIEFDGHYRDLGIAGNLEKPASNPTNSLDVSKYHKCLEIINEFLLPAKRENRRPAYQSGLDIA